jgi:sulfatase maturation enzyme AslB (radical SAM superfamily)
MLDLFLSFHRTDHKLTKLAAYSAHFISGFFGNRFLSIDRWRARNPLHVFILLTSRCNMSCEDCFFIDIINKKSMPRLDFDIEQIKENYKSPLFRSVSRVILYGGEPTMCKDFIKAIRFYRDKGITVSMSTNALRIDKKSLEDLRAADLNILNLSIYEEKTRGQLRNIEKIEEIFEHARDGAFDVDRIEVSYHGVSIENYRDAYKFAQKVGAHHLLFNRTYYTSLNPSDGEHSESATFAEKYLELCTQIEKENRLNLYHASIPGKPNTCSFTTSAFALSPTNELSPCCMVTPEEKYGTLNNTDPLIDLKHAFLDNTVPDICKECHVLGMRHF